MLAGTAKKAVDKAVTRAVPKQAPQKAKQIPQKAKQLPQKAKQLPQKAKQVSRQAGRAAQQAAPGGFKDALKNQDTLANVGGAVLVGLGVLVASSATLGCKPCIHAHPSRRFTLSYASTGSCRRKILYLYSCQVSSFCTDLAYT